MDWKKNLITAAVKVFLFIIYFAGYVVLAALHTGGGHGNFYLFAPVVPLSLTFIAVLLPGDLNYRSLKIIFIFLMTAQYIWIIYYLANYDFKGDKGWRYGIGATILPVLWHLGGQAAIWLGFFINSGASRDESGNSEQN